MKYSSYLKTIKLNQTIGSFFLTKMTPALLNTIANKNLSVYKNSINGIQRDIDQGKIKEIKKYLREDITATFPNTIILAIRDDLNAEAPLFLFDDNENLSVALEPDIANIIDGQHRLAGFDETDEHFELPVAIFINLPLGEQAKLFAKINSTQTKVNLDVVYENFFKSEQRTEEKIAFFLVKSLNERESSPWHNKIKTLSDRTGDLAQGSMAKFIDKRLLTERMPLNQLYLEQRDKEMFELLLAYFNAIKITFPEEWDNNEGVYILTKTTGFVGFMNFFSDILKHNSERTLSTNFFVELLSSVKNNFDPLTNEFYSSGAIGQNKIRELLRASLNIYE